MNRPRILRAFIRMVASRDKYRAQRWALQFLIALEKS